MVAEVVAEQRLLVADGRDEGDRHRFGVGLCERPDAPAATGGRGPVGGRRRAPPTAGRCSVEREVRDDALAAAPAERRRPRGLADEGDHRPAMPSTSRSSTRSPVSPSTTTSAMPAWRVRPRAIPPRPLRAPRPGCPRRRRRWSSPSAGRPLAPAAWRPRPRRGAARRGTRRRASSPRAVAQLPARLEEGPSPIIASRAAGQAVTTCRKASEGQVRRLLVDGPVDREEVRRGGAGSPACSSSCRRRTDCSEAVARRAEAGQRLLGLARDDDEAAHRGEHAPVGIAVDRCATLRRTASPPWKWTTRGTAAVRARLPDLSAGLAELGEHDVDALALEPPARARRSAAAGSPRTPSRGGARSPARGWTAAAGRPR